MVMAGLVSASQQRPDLAGDMIYPSSAMEMTNYENLYPQTRRSLNGEASLLFSD
jgi:hypothetical protein